MYDYILTGREFNKNSFLPSPESDIKMEDKYLPFLYYGLGVIATAIVYSTTIILTNWRMRRCRCCVLHDLVPSEGSSRGDTSPSPAIDLAIITTKPDPLRSAIDGNTSIHTADDQFTHSSIRKQAATI